MHFRTVATPVKYRMSRNRALCTAEEDVYRSKPRFQQQIGASVSVFGI
jgi:hypothetical protein